MYYYVDEMLDMVGFLIILYVLFKEKISFLPRKFFGLLVIYMVGLVFIGLIGQLENVFLWGTAIDILIVIIFLEEEWYGKILSFLLLFLLPSVGDISFTIIIEFLHGDKLLEGFWDIDFGLNGRVITIAICVIIGVYRIRHTDTFYVSNMSKMVLIDASIVFNLLLVFVESSDNISQDKMVMFVALCCITIMVMSCWILIVDASRNKQEVIKKIINQQINYAKELEKNQQEIRKTNHDIKKHLKALDILAKEGDLKRVEEYIYDLNVETDQFEDIFFTVNRLFNGLLLDKIRTASKYSVEVIHRGFLPENIGISDHDLCSIVDNLLDNAIEYSQKEGMSRVVITTNVYEGVVLIKVSNNIKPDDCTDCNKTSKKDKMNHGFGLKNVARVAKKYGGTLDISTENNVFMVTVVLYTI